MKDSLVNIYIDASPLAEQNITGIPHFTAEVVRALDKNKGNGKSFRIYLVIPFDKKKSLKRWNYNNIRIKTVVMPMRLFNLIWKYNLLPPMDLILGKGVYLFPNYKNWPLRNSHSMTYIHDLGFIRYPETIQPKNLKFLKNNIYKWISRTDIILTGADHAKAEITELLKINPSKIVRIYHGVDAGEYYPRSSDQIKKAKAEYGINGNYLLYIGSIEPRKNIQRLVAAYGLLPHTIRDSHSLLLVGGGGWLNEEIIRGIDYSVQQGNNIVRPEKYVKDKDLPAIISGASILVHPAIYEGFGLSPLQAMACGTPVIVGNNSSLPEVVGEAGLLVDARSEQDISAKIEEVLNNESLRNNLKSKGLKQSKQYTWSRTAQEIINCIENLSDK